MTQDEIINIEAFDKMLAEKERTRKKRTRVAPTLEDLMEQGVTGVLNGRKIILGYTDDKKRIGWVWKDTGLPASMEKNT